MQERLNINKVSSGGHAVFMYSSRKSRLSFVVEYFRQGIKNNDLCVFVTPEPESIVIKDFLGAGLDIKKEIKSRAVRIFNMDRTYMPNKTFTAKFMLQNLNDFLDSVKQEGYNGLRTAGEMSWLTSHPQFLDEAQKYEQNVSNLDAQSVPFECLCLYPREAISKEIAESARHTHPTIVYDDIVI